MPVSAMPFACVIRSPVFIPSIVANPELSRTARPPGTGVSTACQLSGLDAPPAGFKGPIYRLNAELLAGGAQAARVALRGVAGCGAVALTDAALALRSSISRSSP